HAHAVDRQRERALRIQARDAEPLPRRRVPVLHAGIADVARIDVAGARDPPHRLERRQIGLLDPQVRVLALAGRYVRGDFFDDERVAGGGEAQHGRPRWQTTANGRYSGSLELSPFTSVACGSPLS